MAAERVGLLDALKRAGAVDEAEVDARLVEVQAELAALVEIQAYLKSRSQAKAEKKADKPAATVRRARPDDATKAEVREKVRGFLEKAGVGTPADIRAAIGVDGRTIKGVLRHESFKKDADGYRLAG